MEFYPSIGVTRDVGSRPDTTHVGLRALTSCRWLFDDMDDDAYFGGEAKNDPQMPGWTYYDTQNGFDIWENEYYIPMGFYYQYYVTPEQYEATAESCLLYTSLQSVRRVPEGSALPPTPPGKVAHKRGSSQF